MFVSRRVFIAAGSAAAAGLLFAAPLDAFQDKTSTCVTIYRLSLRGRRGSRAAKRYNANMRFATRRAADTHRAHPGDRSRIVPLIVSTQEYDRLFTSRHSLVADLRELRNLRVARTRLR